MSNLSPASILYDSGGTEKATSGNPLRIDPTGTTIQPVSGTVTANAGTGPWAVTDNGGSLTVDGTVAATQSGTWNITNISGTISLPTGAATESTLATLLTTAAFQSRIPVNGQAVMAASVPVAISSNQSAIPVSQSGTWNINNISGTVTLPTGAATEATLALIKDTDGIKKITDALPVGNSRIGKVKLVDDNDVRLDLSRNTSIPVGSRGILILGEDASGKAQAADVRVDSVDSIRRLQISGKVSISPPTPPPSTTRVTIEANSPLSITTTTTTSYTITSGKTFYIQQIACGCEGDTSERGSAIEVYFNNGTDHLIERVYVNGFTQYGLFPDTSTARDGTAIVGNGTNTIKVTRRRLSGSSQEVDAVVRGYEQ